MVFYNENLKRKLNFLLIYFILQLDIFFNADQHIQIKGRNGKKYSMSEACEDIVAHEKLTDEVRNY